MKKFCFLFCLSYLVFHASINAQTAAAPPGANAGQMATAQPLDETAVRDFVKVYYATYGTGAAANALALWNAQAPDFAQRKREIESFLGAYRISALRDLTISSVSIENNRAEARVEFRFDSTNPKTGKPDNLPAIARRVLTVAQSGADLKVVNERTVESELAQKIVGAASNDERNNLLAAHPELRNIYLRQALSQQGERLRNEFEYDKSILIFEIVRRIAEENGDQRGFAIAINNIGISYYNQGFFDRATQFYERALKIRTEMNDETGIALGSNNLGLVYMENGNLPAALANFNRAVALAEKLNRREWLAQMLTSKGRVYWKLGDYRQAQQFYEQSGKIFEELNNQAGVAGVWHNTSNLLAEQGDQQAALEMSLKALAVLEPLNVLGDIQPLLNDIAANYYSLGDYRQALVYHERALKLAEEMKSSFNLIISLIGVAESRQKLGQDESALPFIERAVALAEQSTSQTLIWYAQTRRGEILLRLKNYPAARAALATAIEKVETMRAQFGDEVAANQFFSSRLVAYRRLLELELAENNLTAALAVAERTKARALLDVLALGRVEIDKALTAKEKERETELGRKVKLLNQRLSAARAAPKAAAAAHVKKLESELEQARLDYKTFRTELYAAHPELRARRGEAQIIKPTEIADFLAKNPNKVLLEYSVGDDAAYLFAISKAKTGGSKFGLEINVHKLAIKPKDLSERAEALRKIIGTRGDYEAAARRLYDLLVAPAAKQLQGKKELVIVPDGSLWNLPFQALQSPADKSLLETHAVSYAPSLTALREMRAARRARRLPQTGAKDLLAFGNPALGELTARQSELLALRDDKLAPLPDAEQEVLALKNLYGTSKSQVFLGASADEGSVKREIGAARVVHFATHGVLNNQNPLYSHLVFAADKQGAEDGLLEARELLNLELNADLVVLSACETARGRVSAGEG